MFLFVVLSRALFFGKGVCLDDDAGAFGKQIEGLYYVVIFHPDTTVGNGATDEGFLVGAVDVDAPQVGVAVFFFEAA